MMTWPTEVQEALVAADSIMSLVRYRRTRALNDQDIRDLDEAISKCRLLIVQGPKEESTADLREEGRKLASERDDLIAQGVDPSLLAMPLGLLDTHPTVPIRGLHRPHCNPHCLPSTHYLGEGPHEHPDDLIEKCEFCE